MCIRDRTVGEPVRWVSHQMRANCTNWLPSREKACPIQSVKNGLREVGCLGWLVVIGLFPSAWLLVSRIHCECILHYFNIDVNIIDMRVNYFIRGMLLLDSFLKEIVVFIITWQKMNHYLSIFIQSF